MALGFQNDFVGNGAAKSVGHVGPDFAVNERALAGLAEMQLKDVSCTAVFGYFPLKTKDYTERYP